MKLEPEQAWLRRRIVELEAEVACLRSRIAQLRLILHCAEEPRVVASVVELIAEKQSRLDFFQGMSRRKSSLH